MQSLYANFPHVFQAFIKFMDSMSLCGLLVTCLGLPVCVLLWFSVLTSHVVCECCLESMCLILINFLFLIDIPPLIVFTLYDRALTLSTIVPGIQFLTFGTNWMWTESLICKLGRSLMFLLYYFACSCFCLCITFLYCWM